MKNFNRLLLIIGLIVHFIGCSSTPSDSDVIKIGAIASLSGPAGEQGKNWQEGASLAVKEWNDSPEHTTKATLITEDDQTQPSKVVAAFTKLATIDKVKGVIGGTWDFLGEAAYPLARKYKIPFVAPTNPFEVISTESVESGFVFTTCQSLQSVKNALVHFIQIQQAAGVKISRVGIVFPDLPFGTRQAELVRQTLSELGLQSAFEYAFPPASLMSDTVKLAAQKILSSKPDLTYMVIDYNGLDLITKEFASLKIEPQIITTQHLDQAFEFSNDPSRYKNLFAIYPPLDESFITQFQAAYHKNPRVYAHEGYEAAKFLLTHAKESYPLANTSADLSDTGKQARLMTTTKGHFEEMELAP